MKKVLMFSLAAVVFSGVASAAPACSGTLQNSGVAAFNAGGGCELGDKIFNNFGALPVGVGVQWVATGFGAGTVYSVNFIDTSTGGNTLEQSFVESYTVLLDQAAAALIVPGSTAAISTISAGVQGANNSALGTLTKTLSAGGSGTATAATDGAGHTTQVPITGVSFTSFTVTDTWSYSAGVFLNLSNSYQQTFTATTSTPEPVSMLLFGSGLLAVSFMGRKKLVRK